MDWTDTGYTYLVEVAVVSQTNVDEVIGYLRGVGLSDASISENYYSDSRVQAKISTIVKEGESDGYIDNARLRILVLIPSRDWSEEVVTGYVTDISENTERGCTKRQYTIEGTIWGLLDHKISAPIAIAKGATLVATWTSIMGQLTRMQYTTTKAQDHTYDFPSPVIYEAGAGLATILFEILLDYDRMETTGHGVVSLEKYTSPLKREASRIIDFSSPITLSLYPLKRDVDKWEVPGRSIVTATISKTDSNGNATQEVMVGAYDAPSSHFASMATRGWLKVRSDTYSGQNDNPTKDELNTIARKNWEAEQEQHGVTWSCSSVFADYHAGDVVTLISPYTKTGVKALIKSVQTDLGSFTQELTLKEV